MKKLFILLSVLMSLSAYSQNFYGDFESWRSYSVVTAPTTTLQSPSHWFSADSLLFYAKGLFTSANFTRQVYKTTDAHTGSFAAKLITQHEDTFGVIPALLTNAELQLDLSTFNPANPAGSIIFSGGTNVTARIPAISAWVKYFPKGNDTAGIYVQAMKYGIGAGGSDSVIGFGQVLIGNTISNYTKLSIPIAYLDTSRPDFIQIIISSGGAGNATPQDSSTLYVDDVAVEATGIHKITQTQEYKIYPNPATDLLHIDGDAYKIGIMNMFGQEVFSAINPHIVDISTLAPGIYSLQLRDKNGSIIKLEKLIKE